jgi:hypothetical protein
MKNDIKNPVFESLLKNVNSYGNGLYEQKAKAPTGEFKGSQDLFEVAYQLGISIVNGLCTTVLTYPATPYKATYLKAFPGKLGSLSDQIKAMTIEGQKSAPAGTAGTAGASGGYAGSNVIYQVIELEKLVRKEIQDFVNGASVDKDYTDLLSKWQEDITGGINNYKSSIDAIKKQIDILDPKHQVSDTQEGNAKLYKGIDGIKDDVAKAIEETSQKGANMFKKNESKTIIGNLIDNKICVGFNDFNRINLLEKEERRTRRKKEELIKKLEGILSDINNTVNIISSRIDGGGDDVKGFSSLAMAPDFISLNKEALGLKNELEDKNIELTFDEVDTKSGKDNAVQRIYNEVAKKKKLFNETWNSEYSKLSSVKNVNNTNPEIMKYYNNGNAFFSMLATDVKNILFNAANKPKKEEPKKEDKKAAESLLKLSATIKRKDLKGKKNKEVEAFQQMVVKKYADDKNISKISVYKNLKAALDKKQGGAFGEKTTSMIKYLKAGFKLSDTSSDITQELVDKISAANIVKESFLFEQEFDYEAAAKAIGEEGSSESDGDKKVSKGSKKTNSDIVKQTDSKVKVKNSDVKETQDKAPDEVKMDFDAKNEADSIKRKFGDIVSINSNYGKGGQLAIASSPSMRFYSNKAALRLFDKKLGRYSLEDSGDLSGTFKANDELYKEDLKNLVIGGVPKKYSDAINSIKGKNFIANNETKKWVKKAINWTENDVAALATKYKNDFGAGRSLGDRLKDIDDQDAGITAFRRKFDSVIS